MPARIAPARSGTPPDPARIDDGYADPVHDAQLAFRAVLDALARPGQLQRLPARFPIAPGLSRAATAIALALADYETPLWLDEKTAPAAAYLRFHCGSGLVPREQAALALIGAPLELGWLIAFRTGSDEFPDQSTTLLIEVDQLAETGPLRLVGPGIQGSRQAAIEGLPAHFWREWATLREIFPRGVDVIFTCGDALMGLPRTTSVVGA